MISNLFRNLLKLLFNRNN